ncbi:MAG: hypothetical protein ACLTVN_11360 [Blautia hansenii]
MSRAIKKTNIIHLCMIILILLYTLWNISKLNGISVLNDEFGYWSVAASIVGYDWTPLIEATPYYSFGYSLFLAAILFFVDNMVIAYKVAIFLNGLFLVASYFCCCYCIKKLFYEKSNFVVSIISSVTILYSGNIFYSQIAWSETLLMLLMWVSFSIFISLEKKITWWKILFFSCSLGYMYIVHQRTIGIIIAAVIVLVLLLWKKKTNFIYFIFPFVILGGILGIQILVKENLLDTLWSHSVISNTNNVGINKDSISKVLSAFAGEILWLIKSIGGKVYYLIVATAGIFVLSVVKIIKYYFYKLKNKQYKEASLAYLFAFLSICAMIMICAIQTKNPLERLDYIVYSRYMENALGPVLLIGIYSISENKKKENVFAFSVVFFLFLVGSHYVKNIMIDSGSTFFNTVCSPVIGAFMECSENISHFFRIMSLVVIVIILIIMIISSINFLNKYKIVVPLILIIYWGGITNFALQGEYTWRREVEENILCFLDEIEKQEGLELYYLVSPNDYYSRYPKFLQYYIPRKTIRLITMDEVEKLSEDNKEYILFVNNKDNIELKQESIMLKDSKYMHMYKVNK